MLDPDDAAVVAQARADGIPEDWIKAARRSPVYALAKRTASPCRCTRSTARCRWSGTCRRCPRRRRAGRSGTRRRGPVDLFGAIDALRIPVEYLAELFTAGAPTS